MAERGGAAVGFACVDCSWDAHVARVLGVAAELLIGTGQGLHSTLQGTVACNQA